MLYHEIVRSKNFSLLTSRGKSMFIVVVDVLTIFNNGYLRLTKSVLKNYGICGDLTISLALNELLHYQFIVKTRSQRGKKHALYAATWAKIGCKGSTIKLDAKWGLQPWTEKRLDSWKNSINLWVPPTKRKIRARRIYKSVKLRSI